MVGRGRKRRATCLRRAAALAAALATLLLGQSARAERAAVDPARRPRIVNGLTTHGYPTTGALLYGADLDSSGTWCSGTLIGCETFLVAAHCALDLTPSHYRVYLQHAGLVPVVSVTRHPSYLNIDFPLFDVAVIKLGTRVTGITATPINQTDPAPFIPHSGTIVGFGQTVGLGNDYGIKRVGQIQTALCPLDLPAGATDDDVVCWNFLAPQGPAGTNSNTCNGDSGGPLFLDLGSGPVVAGTTSGGSSENCLPTDSSYDANIFTHRAFILGELGADSTAACGGLAPVGDAQTTEMAFDGVLDALDGSDTYGIDVPAGAKSLRVTLNGEDNGPFDPDLYVKQGPGASSASFDCASDSASVYGACTVDLPAAGTWSIAVQRASGAGAYQVTATVFGGVTPSCGNNVREFNETCDGSDAALCPGQCDGSCHCPQICQPDDLVEVKARVDAKKLKVRGKLLNLGGAYTGADPRQGFSLTLTQGANSLSVDIPANAPGWESSRPARGRFKWKGDLNGVSRIKAIDRTAQKGIWKVVVIGKQVPGAGAFNLAQPVELTLTVDGVCTTTTY
jgi:Trypsin/Bacterial pre-peptidase C-terminal domain